MARNDDYATKQLRMRLVNAGVDPQLFDVHSHVDRKLTQRENFINITNMTGTAKPRNYKGHPLLNDKRLPGESLHLDAMRPAKLPGKRTAKSGKTYYENRRNRCDQRGRKI
jgi:hypothetical protein